MFFPAPTEPLSSPKLKSYSAKAVPYCDKKLWFFCRDLKRNHAPLQPQRGNRENSAMYFHFSHYFLPRSLILFSIACYTKKLQIFSLLSCISYLSPSSFSIALSLLFCVLYFWIDFFPHSLSLIYFMLRWVLHCLRLLHRYCVKWEQEGHLFLDRFKYFLSIYVFIVFLSWTFLSVFNQSYLHSHKDNLV